MCGYMFRSTGCPVRDLRVPFWPHTVFLRFTCVDRVSVQFVDFSYSVVSQYARTSVYFLPPPSRSGACSQPLLLAAASGEPVSGGSAPHPRSLWLDFSFWEEGGLMEGRGYLICSNLCFLLDESL